MPYVPAAQAQNAPVMDVAEMLRSPELGTLRALLSASDDLRVVLLRMRQGEEPHRPHCHPHADEAMLVLEGVGTFTVGDEEFSAGPGCLVYAPRGVVHRIRVAGDSPLAWLSIVAPNVDAPDEAVEVEEGRPEPPRAARPGAGKKGGTR